ncbi:hypothetical protein AB0J72_55150 [Dactylosporangium sp. NPDC049742]|uniref:DUF6924 domain-containing protein n=1 Tax=Dactylosporangium sp. NPDC049742 TaxID=3154737 RepID=UPI003429C166
MAELPKTSSVPVVRADFGENVVWERVKVEIAEPTEEGFGADVEFVEDRTLNGLSEAVIANSYPHDYPHRYRHPVLFVVDTIAASTSGHPVLVINLNAWVDAEPFRALARQVQSIQNNLSLANMDYLEFARSTDADGIFRGF